MTMASASFAPTSVPFPPASGGGDGRPRVLVVDDDKSFGGIVADTLGHLGYRAEAVDDPERALEQVRGGGYAAAVVDLVMPGCSGLDLAERLREVDGDVQIVLLTGHPDVGSAKAGIRKGLFAYLQKDEARMAVLERTLADAVARWRLLRRQAELVDDLQDSNRRLHALHEASTTLARQVHVDRLLGNCVDLARRICLARRARLVLLEPCEGGYVVTDAAGDGADDLRGLRLGHNEGIAVLAAESDDALLVPTPVYHPAYSRRCDGLPSAALGLLAAPVRHGSVRGALLVAEAENEPFSPADQEILGAFASQAAIALDNARQRERAGNFFTHTSEILVSFLEALDVHHPGHSRAVAALADLVTRRLGLPESERRTIHFGALLHDIGKIRLKSELLSDGQGFGPDAHRSMQDHTRFGVDLLQPIGAFEEVVAIVKSHHERWDGRGYPSGLKGEATPLGARVVAVADAFDAMGRKTPYREGLSNEAALRELEANAGTQFDPRLVRLFVAAFKDSGDPRKDPVQ